MFLLRLFFVCTLSASLSLDPSASKLASLQCARCLPAATALSDRGIETVVYRRAQSSGLAPRCQPTALSEGLRSSTTFRQPRLCFTASTWIVRPPSSHLQISARKDGFVVVVVVVSKATALCHETKCIQYFSPLLQKQRASKASERLGACGRRTPSTRTRGLCDTPRGPPLLVGHKPECGHRAAQRTKTTTA